MAGRKTKLTPEVQAQIINDIKRGAFDYVAAEAAGIGRTTFYRWMEQDNSEYRAFRDKVIAAKSYARKKAEARVYKESPLTWLRVSARDKPNAEGWTERTETSHTVKGELALFNYDTINRLVAGRPAGNPDASGDD